MATSRPKDATAAAQAPTVPAPPFAGLWASLVYAVVTLSLAYPALTGAFLVNVRSDQYKIGYAFREYAAEWLRSGRGFPQWNPYLYGGMPYVAAMHGDIFYPTFLLRMIMPTDVAMTWEFPIHVFLAGLFTYGFLRAWGFGFFPSLTGGLAYLLTGMVASLVSPGHDGKLFVSALFPLALWMLVRGMRDGRRWAWGALAVTVGLAVLSPHPQLLQYMLLGSGVFALYLAFADVPGQGKLPRDVAIRRLGLALAAVIVGALIGAVQFLPVKEYVPFSPRAGGRGYDYATSFSMPIEEIFNTYLPQFSGILDRYWGRNMIHFHSEYIGAAVLVLMGAAFGTTARRSFRRFWVVTGCVALLWALGGSTPFYHIVYAIVPGAHYFRAPSTIFFIVSFSCAVLGAMGLERILAGQVGRRYILGWGIAAAAIALLMSVGGYTVLANAVANSMADMYGPDQHAAAVDAFMQRAGENSTAAIVGAWRSFVVVAIACGLLWMLLKQRASKRAIAWALVGLVAVDLWSVERIYWQFSPRAAQLYAPDETTRYMQQATASDPGRVAVLEVQSVPGLMPQDPMLTGCSGGTGGPSLMVHRLRNVTGCHGNEMGRFQRLGDYSPDTAQAYNVPKLITQPLAHHENVHFLLTNVPDSLMPLLQAQLKAPAPFVKVLGPARTAAGSTVNLYRVPGDNPAAWVASAIVKADDDAAFATITSPNFDPGRAALLDSSSSIAAVPVASVPAAAAIRARTTRFEPGAIDVTLDQPASAGQALVVSENYFPGWAATADARPAQVARMNLNLIGVALPAGARTIQLRFVDHAYETGKYVTLVALLLAVVAWIAGAVVDRRTPLRSVA